MAQIALWPIYIQEKSLVLWFEWRKKKKVMVERQQTFLDIECAAVHVLKNTHVYKFQVKINRFCISLQTYNLAIALAAASMIWPSLYIESIISLK